MASAKICVLSKQEVACWENYKDRPACLRRHRHITRKEALQGIRDDVYREVDGLPAVTAQDSNDRVWRGRPSDGMNVLQFVPRA